MYDFLIYDFDGTLSDTYPIFTEAFLKLMEKYDIPRDWDTVYGLLKQSIGAGLNHYDFPMSKKEAREEFEAIYEPIALEKQQLFPESEEILRFGMEKGKKNYVYTHSGLWVYALMERMGIRDCFDFVLDCTYDFPRKPAPDALNFLIEKCGIDKSRALMIGDRDLDIEVAHNAGIDACLFDPENYYSDLQAEYRITSLLELKDII